MTDAEKAYEAALVEIERVKASGETWLDLDSPDFRDLARIPPEIAGLTGLDFLELRNTKISDLSPLAGMAGLQTLWINQTGVGDLSPLVRLTRLKDLRLFQTVVGDLSPLAKLTGLQTLWLTQTEVSDLSPLVGLTGLMTLSVDETEVRDLRPIRGAVGLAEGFEGLSFRETAATRTDAELLHLSLIKDAQQRGRETLAYLNTLPPWPEPYTPARSGDGSPPRPIGRVAEPEPPQVRAAQGQIKALLRQALVTRVSAKSFALQIEDALRGVPATHGNELEPALQQMAEVAEVLNGLAADPEVGTAAALETRLRLRIAQLEAIVEKLTAELRDETAARKAAEALAKKDGFLQSYRKGLGTSAAVGTIGLISVGVPTAAVYFLGVEHPLVQAFLTAIGRLPKP